MSREEKKTGSLTPISLPEKKKGNQLDKPPTILRTIVQRQ
jgi:hypothetical protein